MTIQDILDVAISCRDNKIPMNSEVIVAGDRSEYKVLEAEWDDHQQKLVLVLEETD